MVGKKGKKVQYTLSVYGYETLMVPLMDIGKKKFATIKTQLDKMVAETQDREYPTKLSVEEGRGSGGHSTYTEYLYTVGTTDVFLKEEVCDEGYHFVSKS